MPARRSWRLPGIRDARWDPCSPPDVTTAFGRRPADGSPCANKVDACSVVAPAPVQGRPAPPPVLFAEHFLEEARHRDLVLAVGALFRRTVRIGEGVRGATVKLELPVDLGGA